MKAEVTFVIDAQNQFTERLKLIVRPESTSEAVILEVFARRLGRTTMDSGMAELSFEEPVP